MVWVGVGGGGGGVVNYETSGHLVIDTLGSVLGIEAHTFGTDPAKQNLLSFNQIVVIERESDSVILSKLFSFLLYICHPG